MPRRCERRALPCELNPRVMRAGVEKENNKECIAGSFTFFSRSCSCFLLNRAGRMRSRPSWAWLELLLLLTSSALAHSRWPQPIRCRCSRVARRRGAPFIAMDDVVLELGGYHSLRSLTFVRSFRSRKHVQLSKPGSVKLSERSDIVLSAMLQNETRRTNYAEPSANEE